MNAENSKPPAVSLATALVGQTVAFAGVVGGAGHGLMRRLAELGLTPGAKMEILRRGPGPFIISARGCRMVLGRGMVSRILVRPVL